VTGKVTGGVLVYTIPISGTSFLGFSDTLKVDETGNFELKLEIIQPAFLEILRPKPFKQTRLLIEPGENYNVVIDKEIQITGANEKGQMLYASLPYPSYIAETSITQPFYNDTSLVSIHEKIEKTKQDELSKFKELLDNKEISPSFFRLIQTDRNCYYASLEAMVSIIKMHNLVKNENDNFSLEVNKDLLENLRKIYSLYPPDDTKFLFSTFWYEYAEYYIKDYNQYLKKDLDVNEYVKLYDTRNTVINESKNYLKGKTLEYLKARALYTTAFQTEYEKSLISLFEQFKKDYPESKYSEYLEPMIDKIVKFYQIADREFNADIKFVENYSKINTLEEAVKPLKGKKIYIDVWATWCSPCRSEFKNNNEALKKILAENDIQQLYISIDDDVQNQLWLDMIKFYNLTGNHIRVNKEFETDLRKLFDKNGGIGTPWYILVDENGNIIDKHAKRPSQLVAGEKLINNE
jgi:thiol-disulfide isomerase/thioredoxin